MVTKFENLKIHEKEKQRLQFIADLTGKTIAQVIEEFADAMFQLAVSHDSKAFNIEYQMSILEDSILILWSGSRNLKVGSIPHSTLDSDDKADALVREQLMKGDSS